MLLVLILINFILGVTANAVRAGQTRRFLSGTNSTSCEPGYKNVDVIHHATSIMGKEHKNWALYEGCENYEPTAKGTHPTSCCLKPGKYVLHCLSHPKYAWGPNSYVEVDGNKYCQNVGEHAEEKVEVEIGGSSEPVEPLNLPECDSGNGVKVNVDMFVRTVFADGKEDMKWKFSDACSGSGVGGSESEKLHTECCLPKGKYTLSCQSGFFSWGGSWLVVNGRKLKECLDVDGGELTNTREFDFCNGMQDCPQITTVAPTKKPGISITFIGNGTSSNGTINLGGSDDLFGDLLDEIEKEKEKSGSHAFLLMLPLLTVLMKL